VEVSAQQLVFESPLISSEIRILPEDSLLTCVRYCIDVISQSSISLTAKRRQSLEPLLSRLWLVDQIAESVGIDENILIQHMRSTVMAIFPEVEHDNGAPAPAQSRRHRYGD